MDMEIQFDDIIDDNSGVKVDNDEPIPIKEESPIQEEPCRYLQRVRSQNKRHFTGSLRRTRTDDIPTARDALTSEDAEKWKASMDKEAGELEQLDSWTKVERPMNKVLHTKFVLKKKRDANGNIANKK